MKSATSLRADGGRRPMIDLLVEHRHGLAVALMGAAIVGLFIRQGVSRKRRLSRMARECRHEATRQEE